MNFRGARTVVEVDDASSSARILSGTISLSTLTSGLTLTSRLARVVDFLDDILTPNGVTNAWDISAWYNSTSRKACVVVGCFLIVGWRNVLCICSFVKIMRQMKEWKCSQNLFRNSNECFMSHLRVIYVALYRSRANDDSEIEMWWDEDVEAKHDWVSQVGVGSCVMCIYHRLPMDRLSSPDLWPRGVPKIFIREIMWRMTNRLVTGLFAYFQYQFLRQKLRQIRWLKFRP